MGIEGAEAELSCPISFGSTTRKTTFLHAASTSYYPSGEQRQ
jgi:hypothetical protein